MAEETFLTLNVRVQPRAGRQKLWVETKGGLRAALQSPPEGGRANKELVEMVARQLRTARSNVEVWKGLKSRNKVLRLWNVKSAKVEWLVEQLKSRG
jgi:uncharacterized protein